jgi:hypothetical protein
VAHKRRRLNLGGRPRKAQAKRRATTTEGRRPETDLGSPELIVRKAAVTNGSAAPVELVDVAGILCAHEMIAIEELAALRLLASWLAQFRRGFGLREASVTGLWAALLSGGARGGLAQPEGRGGDKAMFRLFELYSYWRAARRPEAWLQLALQVAAGESAPGDDRELAELKNALQVVMAHQRGRRWRRLPARLRGVAVT